MSSHGEWDDVTNYPTAPARLSPSQQHSVSHDGGAQRGAAHFTDASLAARLRAGRKSATAPYDAFSAARMGPPTPPLVPGAEASGLFDNRPVADGGYPTSSASLRRHTLSTDMADISGWSTIPTEFASTVLQNPQQSVVTNIAY